MMNIIDEYRKELLDFYSPHFKNDIDLNAFVDLAFNYDDKYSQVRFMIQQVYHFVSLANDIDKIRPARDSLKIFFLKTCIESLFYICGKEIKKPKFYENFENCFDNDAKSYIRQNFKYTGIDIPKELDREEQEEYYEYENKKFTFSCFMNLIKSVRDMVVHDGDYWSMQFFAYDKESMWITEFKTKDDILEFKKTKEMVYHFQTTLDYDRFIYYFVKACITLIGQENAKCTDK